MRTHTCGALGEGDVGKTAVLNGWVANYRDHGGVTFIDLYDRWGMTQVVFDPEHSGAMHRAAHGIRSQYVIAVKGEVRMRPEGMENPSLPTGMIDLYVADYELLNVSKTPPFDVQHAGSIHEETRLKYRYLDLRSPRLQEAMKMRSSAMHVIRNVLWQRDFLEIETPILGRSTPEGARDYLVPSRVHPGKFFALPQSPQLYKQSLMVSGMERYFQIARCFRDEDLRADRQPEFTQLDMELSFVSREEVMEVTERVLAELFQTLKDVEVALPFPRITYRETMLKYGSDAPDLRFALEIQELSDLFTKTSFGVFKTALRSGGVVRGINLKGFSSVLSRKDLDDLTPFVKSFRGKGVAWIRMTEQGPQSPIIKFFSEEEADLLYERFKAEEGDVLIFAADSEKIVCQCLGALRVHLAGKLGLIDPSQFAFTWVTEFPLFGRDDQNRPAPMHHPFTAPVEEDVERLEEDPFSISSDAYDIVLNGSEIGGGSIRIHDERTQQRVFSLLGIDEEQARDKFGFLLEALAYGAPPHGGIALGLDRIMMILLGTSSIRDVIAFPKTQRASCLMTGAPNMVDQQQLDELYIESFPLDEDD